jgi:haloalkane dehalogenase
MTWDTIRTPGDRFANLPGYGFESNYIDIDGIRVHYLDEGAGKPVVLFHGEPTWSFLYRRIIGPLTTAGYRSIVPDYPGFGMSDKPTDPSFYTYDRHVEFMAHLVEHLDLDAATAVVQDWGGPIGLRLAVEHPDRFDRLVIMNTGLFSGNPTSSPGFVAWRAFVEKTEDLPIGMIMANTAATTWPVDVLGTYEAPFPDVRFKVGAREFPLIVPMTTDDPGAAAQAAVKSRLEEWTKPVQVLFGDSDPIFSLRVGERWSERVPGAGELEIVAGAGHFLQEDRGEEVAERIIAFLERSG